MTNYRAALLAGAAALIAAPAYAQTGPTSVEELIVTALRRETLLQDTPIAVSAFSQSSLNDAKVSDLASLQSLVPNLTVEQHGDSGGVHVYLRGIGSSNHTELGDPAVSFHIDSVYSPRPQGATQLMYDVSHVEVLRGPQGTLFGRNSTAGSVNIVTAKPKFDAFSGDVEVTVGDYNRFSTRGHVNIPLSDTFAIRLAAATEKHDGYVAFQARSPAVFSDKYNNADQQSFRLTALWAPSEALTVTGAVEYFKDQGTGNIALLQTPRPGTDRYSALVDTPGFLDQDNLGYRLRVDWRPADWVEVSYIGGLNQMSRRNASDNDAGATPGFKQEHRTDNSSFDSYSHEIQARSTGEGRFDWIVGAFLASEDNAIRFDIDITSSAVPGTGPLVVTPSAPGDQAWSMSFIQPKRTLDSRAFYAQGTFDVTDALRLTLGARRTTDEKEDRGGRNWVCSDFGGTIGSGSRILGPGTPVTLATCNSAHTTPANPTFAWPGGGINDGQTKDSKTTWLVRGEWDLSENVMTYASVSTGFKSGGLSDGGRRHLPEELTSYEVGAKTVLLDGALTLNAAAFFMDYQDLQVSAVERLPSGQQQLVTSNAAAATIKGVELEFAWRPTENDRLSGFASILNAEYDEFLSIDTTYFDQGNLANTVDLAGQPLRHAPEFSATVIYEHDFDLASGGRIVPRIQFHYEGDTVISAFNNVYPSLYRGAGAQDAYTKTDLAVRYEAPDDRWQVEAFVQNIENEAVKTDIQNIGASSNGTPTSGPTNLGTWVGFYNPPRTWGVRLHARF
ncbi:MAG: TonB-dependent receptor [Phenylobacterium sp.]|uniref:TonB-dependent receptor n=1 Tax=Phenylobacterium sp. TaxID=1871053 RepID=UPI0027347E66|nr:TonB-dependent receptor [Phenylobacterium sp.]MDP3745750.1 TonB-dependent receptor [Phenylobacterium sp.]